MRAVRQLIAISLFFGGVAGNGFAQRDYFPSIKNTKGEGTHDIPLGPIGGVARIKFDDDEAEIVSLMSGGPGARAGLKTGMVITSANGKSFPDYSKSDRDGGEGPPEVIGLAILESQASGSPLRLGVSGGEIAVSLKPQPMLTKDFSAPGELVSLMSSSAAEALAERQKDDGRWGNDYTTAFCGLALLATGDKSYRREVEKAIDYLADKYDLGSRPSDEELKTSEGSNWMVCQVGILLAEYYLATGKRSVLEPLQHCCDRMAKRIHAENGRFGHNKTSLPYSEKGLVIINTHAHIMWALAKHAGCSIDEKIWDLSLECVQGAMTGSDAVGYNSSARSGSQGGARTGSMATGLMLYDDLKSKGLAKRMGKWLGDHFKEFPDAHAMTSIGLVYGTSGLKTTSFADWKDLMEYYRWMFALCQPADWDQGMYYFGQKGNHGGDSYLGYQNTAQFIALMMLESYRDDALWMFGNRSRNWYGSSSERKQTAQRPNRVNPPSDVATTPPSSVERGGRLSMFKTARKVEVDAAAMAGIDAEVVRTLNLMFRTGSLKPVRLPVFGQAFELRNVNSSGSVSLDDGERVIELMYKDLPLADRARLALLPTKVRGMDEHSAARIAFYLLAMEKGTLAEKYLRHASAREAEIRAYFKAP